MDPENNNEQVGTQQQEGQQAQQTGAQPQEQKESKSYTQEQLNAMMANEKRTARQAILKELGFEFKDDKSFNETIKGIKKTLDAGKTQQQLDNEAKNQAEKDAQEALARAELAEMKVSALSAGVKPDRLDDMILLAKAKISDTVTVEKAFADLKKSYPDAFGVESSGGTGSHTNPARKAGTDEENRGTRLAKFNKPSAKSSYFKN